LHLAQSHSTQIRRAGHIDLVVARDEYAIRIDGVVEEKRALLREVIVRLVRAVAITVSAWSTPGAAVTVTVPRRLIAIPVAWAVGVVAVTVARAIGVVAVAIPGFSRCRIIAIAVAGFSRRRIIAIAVAVRTR
jgi:hypothetical protein